MNRPYLTLAAVIGLVALSAVGYAAYDYVRPKDAARATTTPEAAVTTPRAYGEVTLALGETAAFNGLSVTPQAILEDSRCPVDVVCIQAGTVRVRVQVVSGMGTSTNDMQLGGRVTTEAEEIRFTALAPDARSGEAVDPASYRLTFEVVAREVKKEEPRASGGCYVGGCSMQLCTDRPDMVSTCEYRDSYACYKGATCERQASGACGWTPTPELTACLKRAP